MKKRLLLTLFIVLICLLALSSCGSVEVTWIDADGTVLYVEDVPKDETIPQKDLPVDNDQWHYTQWRQIVSGKKNATFLADRVEKIHVVWQDGDGTVLYEEYVPAADITEKPLPTDVGQWHYTGWKQTTFGMNITYVANRVSRQLVAWLDGDGNRLANKWIVEGEKIPDYPLPKDTDKWHYTGWSETYDGNEYTYIPERELREDYFVGNVFQIVIKDLVGTPLGTGTGFVFNKDGWFITNAHVMENAYQAVAIFEIKDSATGESFTTLEIKNCSYIHYDKDIFIGKIEKYSKVSRHYKDIPFQSDHFVGDITYSVGYPKSSVSMEIHKGEIKKDLSFLYDKLYSGISYIASDSYIAPGSSGGILINENAEVIGMTTLGWFDDDENFELGAAIEAYNYISLTEDIKNSDIQDLAIMLHPEKETFIKFFRDVISWKETKKIVEDGLVYYMYTWEDEKTTDKGTAYSYESKLCVFADGLILYNGEYYWDNGDYREQAFGGYYSSEYGLDKFSYAFKYGWKSGNWYSIASDNINYSENLKLTLRNYTESSSYGYTVSYDNIEYAKKNFNNIYKWLYDTIEKSQ